VWLVQKNKTKNRNTINKGGHSMKKVLLLLVIVAALSAAHNRKLETVLPNINDERANLGFPVLQTTSPVENLPIIGRIEVVGYTTYDWQYNGPVYTHCRYCPTSGVEGLHCYWMYSNFNPGTDRNQRYNFYDFTTRTWNWPLQGVNVYSARSGFGSFDYDPVSGCGVALTHQSVGGVLSPVAARDIFPGGGLFEYSTGPSAYQWPAVGVTQNQALHVACVDGASSDSIWYTRCQPWGTWTTPMKIHTPGSTPLFPDHNIAASKTSNKVVILWECSEDPYPERAFYRISLDGGLSWQPEVQLPFPPSMYGVNPSYHISSLFAMFDNQDNLRIVASVMHYDGTSGYTIPSQIWLYSPQSGLPNPWTLIHHYDADTLNAPVGYNATFACRPSITQASDGKFYVAWEQFDSLNYEPTTTLARADIWVAEVSNNGQTVTRKGRITDPNTTSKRFPCVGGVKDDTVFVQYFIDSIAGFELYTQGRTTLNPVVLHRFHRNHLPATGIEENAQNNLKSFGFTSINPNPSAFRTTITYNLPQRTDVEVNIYDITGRPVRKLFKGMQSEGENSLCWDGKDDKGNRIQPGLYFVTLKTEYSFSSSKIIRSY
jgi:hypothetical protein